MLTHMTTSTFRPLQKDMRFTSRMGMQPTTTAKPNQPDFNILTRQKSEQKPKVQDALIKDVRPENPIQAKIDTRDLTYFQLPPANQDALRFSDLKSRFSVNSNTRWIPFTQPGAK